MACRKTVKQAALLRVAKTKTGTYTLGRGDGRGVYVCQREECITTAMKKRKLEHGLRTKLNEETTRIMESYLLGQLG